MAAKKKSEAKSNKGAARASAEKRKGAARRGASPGKKASVRRKTTRREAGAKVAGSAEDPRVHFVRLVTKIGTDEAQRLLDAIVDVQTPTSGSSR